MRCLHCHTDGLPLNTEICPNCGAYLPSLMRDLLRPQQKLRANTYQIDYPLGRGGFGVTYRGHHTLLQQIVAIKEYYPQNYALRNPTTGGFTIPTNQQETYQRGLQRFIKEGQTLAKLNHPHVVKVSDLFQENDTAYLVMELVTGKTLRNELDSQPQKKLSPEKVIETVNQLVSALSAVHKQGIFHLDIKPDNILLTPEKRLVLIDFGSAKQTFGTRIGTFSTRTFTEAYAAPEVMAGGEVGVESDIFELGMMVYEMLTGRLPDNALQRLLGDSWKPEGLNSPWRELVMSALVLKPESRPKNIEKWWDMVSATYTGKSGKVLPLQKFGFEVKTTGNSGKTLPLQKFGFEVKTVSWQGKETNRCRQEAEFFAEDLGNGVILEMVYIPGGSFLMGSPETEKGRYDSETPQHRVTVQPFFMAKYPVTQRQYEIIVGENPSGFKGENLPVENVSWNNAVEFCQKLTEKTGKKRKYRLPSEAEWEYACRAGTTTPFYFGETITFELANYDGRSVYASEAEGIYRRETTEVGSFPPNAFGLYDMHGNVWEWCQDAWHGNYTGAPADGSAWEVGGDSNFKVLRGGCWSTDPRNCRGAIRNWGNADNCFNDRGFRVVCLPGI